MKWSFWSCPQHQRAAIWWGSVALCSIVIGGLLSRCESEPAYASPTQTLDEDGIEYIKNGHRTVWIVDDVKRGITCYVVNDGISCVKTGTIKVRAL